MSTLRSITPYAALIRRKIITRLIKFIYLGLATRSRQPSEKPRILSIRRPFSRTRRIGRNIRDSYEWQRPTCLHYLRLFIASQKLPTRLSLLLGTHAHRILLLYTQPYRSFATIRIYRASFYAYYNGPVRLTCVHATVMVIQPPFFLLDVFSCSVEYDASRAELINTRNCFS